MDDPEIKSRRFKISESFARAIGDVGDSDLGDNVMLATFFVLLVMHVLNRSSTS